MNKITIEDVFCFQKLQSALLKCFFRLYPSVKDFDLLLDFPRKGSILLADDSSWSFLKHGKGIRFDRTNPNPKVCVDVNTHVQELNLITSWRLSNYFSSLGQEIELNEIRVFLLDMESKGILKKVKYGYIV
jgi:hypothetical protein